jgi:hypothetical protein
VVERREGRLPLSTLRARGLVSGCGGLASGGRGLVSGVCG